MGGHGRRIDDGAAAMSQHVFSCRDIGQEDSVQVDVDHLAPLRIGHFLRRRVDTDARIVVAEIQSSQFLRNLLYHGVHLLRIRAVRADRDDLTARLFRQLCCGLFCLRNIQIHDRHVCACFCKCRCRALSNPSCRSCYKSFFPVQFHFFNNSHDSSPFLLINFVK